MSKRMAAAFRMLLDSGDITPMGVRILQQIMEESNSCDCEDIIQRVQEVLDERERRIEAALAACQGTYFARCNKHLRGES